MHINTCGPFHTHCHGYKYFTYITDDATRYRWILLLKTKDEVIPKFQEWSLCAETRSEKKVKVLRSNHGVEFTSYAFENLLKEGGLTMTTLLHITLNITVKLSDSSIPSKKKTKTMQIGAKLLVTH